MGELSGPPLSRFFFYEQQTKWLINNEKTEPVPPSRIGRKLSRCVVEVFEYSWTYLNSILHKVWQLRNPIGDPGLLARLRLRALVVAGPVWTNFQGSEANKNASGLVEITKIVSEGLGSCQCELRRENVIQRLETCFQLFLPGSNLRAACKDGNLRTCLTPVAMSQNNWNSKRATMVHTFDGYLTCFHKMLWHWVTDIGLVFSFVLCRCP